MRIFVVAAILAFAPIAMAIQNKPSGTQNRKAAQQTNPAVPISVNCNCTTKKDDSKDKPQGWYKLITWPEGVATWALILTLGAIVWQACESRRSANISERAVIASLRPKLVVRRISLIPGKLEEIDGVTTLKDDHQWRIGCVIANIGGSNARITESDLTIKRLGVGTIQGLLPNLPPYEGKYSFAKVSIEPGLRQEEVIVMDKNTDTMRFRLLYQMAKNGQNTNTSPLVCFGFLHYRDDSGIGRRTGFGWRWNPDDMSFTRLEHPEYEYTD